MYQTPISYASGQSFVENCSQKSKICKKFSCEVLTCTLISNVWQKVFSFPHSMCLVSFISSFLCFNLMKKENLDDDKKDEINSHQINNDSDYEMFEVVIFNNVLNSS